MTNGLPATIKEWREQHSEMAIIIMPLQMLEKLYEYSNARHFVLDVQQPGFEMWILVIVHVAYCSYFRSGRLCRLYCATMLMKMSYGVFITVFITTQRQKLHQVYSLYTTILFGRICAMQVISPNLGLGISKAVLWTEYGAPKGNGILQIAMAQHTPQALFTTRQAFDSRLFEIQKQTHFRKEFHIGLAFQNLFWSLKYFREPNSAILQTHNKYLSFSLVLQSKYSS